MSDHKQFLHLITLNLIQLHFVFYLHDLSWYTSQGNTALIHAASLSDGAAMVEMLLHNNASIDGANNYGCTPLIAAARSNSIECLSILLGRGADVIAKCNERGRDKDALLMAATYGHFECLRKLCAMDTVDIKVVDEEGYSCLMLALLSDNPKQTVQVILDAMTSLEDKIGIEMLRCQNKDGETAASMAKALDIRIVKRREEDAEQAIASAQAIRSAQLAAREVDYFVRSKFFEDPAYTPPDLSPEVKQSTEEAVNSSYFAALIAAKDEAFMRQQVLNRTKLEVELATEKAAEDRFRLKTKLRRVAKAVGKKGFRALAGGVSDLIHHNNKGT